MVKTKRIPERPRKRGVSRVEIGSYKLELRPAHARTEYDVYDRTAGTCIAREVLSSEDAWLVYDARGMFLGTLEESTGDEPWVCQRAAVDGHRIPRRCTIQNQSWFVLKANCQSGATWMDALAYGFCSFNGIISDNNHRVMK